MGFAPRERNFSAIVLSFLKVPLTIVPKGLLLSVTLAFQDWISKVPRLQWAKGKRMSDWENEIKPFSIFSLILAWTEATPAVRSCCTFCQPQWLLVEAGVSSILPAPPCLLSVALCPKLSPCQLLLGSPAAPHRLYLCASISQPGGLTAKILAASATLRLCLRSHFCSCACLHLILFALTSMQMQQQAQAVRCSLYYYGFFSLFNHCWLLKIELK